ncbi:UNVERIFIED_CONTAM: hypothetical protein K2H54_043678 [Gekko kuhli]
MNSLAWIFLFQKLQGRDLWDHEALRDPQDLLALKDFKAALVNLVNLALVVQWVLVGHLGHPENLVMMVNQANLANQEIVDHLGHRVTLGWMVPREKLVLQALRVRPGLQAKVVLLAPWVLVVFREREGVLVHLVLL